MGGIYGVQHTCIPVHICLYRSYNLQRCPESLKVFRFVGSPNKRTTFCIASLSAYHNIVTYPG